MNPEIFREYDIRGVVEKDLTDQGVILIGKAFGTYLQSENHSKVSVGRDCRLSSEHYQHLLTEGLLASGCDVVDIGVCPTPVFYFSIRHLKKEGGVMVTASHNPPEYNGFKLCSGYDTLFGKQIQKVRQMIDGGTFAEGRGNVETADVITPYKKFVEENIKLAKSLRVGIDAGNGPAGVVAVPIIRNLGCEVFDLFCDMDGNFPNHEPDPTVEENMQDLMRLVREKGLHVGIGYDGDGDRIGVIDEKGDIIWGDQLMIMYAREILSRKPGATFIAEVKCSQTLYDDIEKHGGRSVMSKTGHSLIKQKMKEVKAELAGEMSGHMFFADRYFGYDDAVYASCRLLEILAATGKSITELLSDVPKTYNTPEIRVPCPDNIKFQVVKEITEYFRQRYDIIDIDGVRILFEDGWGLVRASNTQPVLVLRFETLSQARLSEIQSLVESVLAEIQKRY
ncbi:MAG: phosphomannomutase/phosphoglucomutase [Desulfobacterales bacterium]|nr:MAG: phosphomannomutase/phosphoglucomutase [Desulfobacterales bacterium]UCG81963.1 MAG: phosphomannomutase/phosphoglucomutase [Desulfobacterales bacterium]